MNGQTILTLRGNDRADAFRILSKKYDNSFSDEEHDNHPINHSALVVQSDGKVGIGISNPQAPTLHTVTNDTYNQVIIETKAPARAAGYQLLTPEGKWILENRSLLDDQNQPVKDTSDFVIRQSGGDNPGEKFVVQHTTGKVGIGTNAPDTELQISGLGRVKATSEDGSAWSYYSTENATNNKSWQFGQLIGDREDYNDQFFILPTHFNSDGNAVSNLDHGLYITNDSETPTNSGRVGIGRRDNIMTKLDVLGSSRVSGELLVPEGEGNNKTGGMLKTLTVEGTRSAYREIYYINNKSSQKRYFLNIILPGYHVYQQFKINVATHRRSIDNNTTHWMKYGYFEDKGYACGENDWEDMMLFHEDGLGVSDALLTGVGNAFTEIKRNSFFIHAKDPANIDGSDLNDLGFTKLSGDSKVRDSANNLITMSAKVLSYELTLPHDSKAETGSQIPLVVNVELLDNNYSILPHTIPVAKIIEVAV